MIRWVVLHTTPPRQIHAADARAYIDPAEIAHEVLAGIGTQRSTVSGEIPNVTVTIENSDAQAMAIFADPPAGAEASIMGRVGNANVEQFRGVVVRGSVSAQCDLEISA